MNHLPSRPERDALLPFVEARLRELSFLAARIRHETATPEAAIRRYPPAGTDAISPPTAVPVSRTCP